MAGGFNLMEAIWQSGLIVKFVLLLLIALMIVTWSLVILYFKYFKEVRLADEDYKKLFDVGQASGDINTLEGIFQQTNKYPKSSFAFIFQEVYLSLIKLNDKLVANGKGDIFENIHQLKSDYLERSVHKSIAEFILQLDRYRGYLATISNISPFVGLFGTVWGIIHAFGGLANGAGSIESVAPGIAEALVTTAIGIGASIPASWFYNYFSLQMNRQKTRMNNFSLDVQNQLDRIFLSYKKNDKSS